MPVERWGVEPRAATAQAHFRLDRVIKDFFQANVKHVLFDKD